VGWYPLSDTGLLGRFIPELLEDQDGPIQVFDHLCRTCDCSPVDDTVLRWAALLHDIAKPRCADTDDRGLHFHGHDELSARMTAEILTRLRYSGERVHLVSHLVRHHMFGYSSEWSDAAVRRFLVRVGSENVPRLIALCRADACGKTGRPPVNRELDELESRARSIALGDSVLSRDQLAVGGRDLMEALGLAPGPRIGIILEELMQTVLDDPALNDRESLLRIAENLYRERLLPDHDQSD
jgi:tRNA nucleotidyltransferase (CCA-adding enzyme)